MALIVEGTREIGTYQNEWKLRIDTRVDDVTLRATGSEALITSLRELREEVRRVLDETLRLAVAGAGHRQLPVFFDEVRQLIIELAS